MTFVYYRQYHGPILGQYINGDDDDIDRKLLYFRQETEQFVETLARLYPQLPLRLLSLFMEPEKPTAGVTDKVDDFFSSLTATERIRYERVLRRRSGASLASWDALLSLL